MSPLIRAGVPMAAKRHQRRSRGAEFITEPKLKYRETRCYIREPDGYIIEIGQSNPGVAYG
jgi:hypothetical protein